MTDTHHITPASPEVHPHRIVGWAVTPGLTPYPAALAAMERRAADIHADTAPELVWLLEHPPLYTAGTSARREDLLSTNGFPVYDTGRGGQYTYHGPGQRIAYVMVDVRARFGGDIHLFVATLERWLIDTLARLGIEGVVREGRVGVWVPRRTAGTYREDKIAALGIRVRHGVSFHGVSLNVSPNLSHYDGIVPCGIRDHGVTSIMELTGRADMAAVDEALRAAAPAVLGSIENRAPPL